MPIPSAFNGPDDGALRLNRTPLVLDILGPDLVHSILPDRVRLVLHANPSSLKVNKQRQVDRIQTLGGFVEQHWGDATQEVSADGTTGGFVRLYTGVTSATSSAAAGGSRRETIAYDKFLDLMAMFRSNGAVYDAFGNIAIQGAIKLTFDEGSYIGWFQNFSMSESAETPYRFTYSFSFIVSKEITTWRTTR